MSDEFGMTIKLPSTNKIEHHIKWVLRQFRRWMRVKFDLKYPLESRENDNELIIRQTIDFYRDEFGI